ncbi:MAG: tetratricopeptide repeat protein [Myxococcales bacterium]|nr:tetratricopeptide repeat protein [Myxococcales bacterium]
MSDPEAKISDPPEHNPMDQFSAHLDRGWDLVHRGDFEGAQRSAEKSLELDAESPEAHNLAGYVHAALGDADSALQHYQQAIALDDSFVEAMLNAAEVLIHPLHDFRAAIDLIDDALDWTESDEEAADALLVKFDAYMHQGEFEKARRVLSTVPDSDFETARLDFMVGRAHFEVGEMEAARARLERALGKESDNPDVRYYMGLVLDATGEHGAATLEFLRTRELDLASPPVPWELPQDRLEGLARRIIGSLDETLQAVLDGVLVVVADVPGPEVVADGVDPRAPLLLDGVSGEDEPPHVGRLFIYRRNAERMSESADTLEDDLQQMLHGEILAIFPALAPSANGETPTPS